MAQDLNTLKEIQEQDIELYSLRETLEELPQELEKINREQEEQRKQLSEAEADLKATQLKQKEKEVELQSKEENVRKYEGQLAQIKTNKEYSSLQDEIKSLKADNSILEEAIIKLIDQTDVVSQKVSVEKAKLAETEKLLKQKKVELEEKQKVMQKRIDEIVSWKQDKIKAVDPEIASLYEQIVSNKHGLALVHVEGESCPACQIQLRPQVLNELKLKEKIVICENCSRILYE